MPITDSKLSLLKSIELCVTIFRGPDNTAWKGIYRSGLPELLEGVQNNSAFAPDALRQLAAALDDCARTDGGFDDLEPEYVRLFIAGPGGVPAPLYESCHLDDAPRTMGQSALRMKDRLASAGLAVDLDSNEPPDHLTIELEYLYHLLATGWSNDDQNMEAMGVAFATDAMLPWVHRFREALIEGAPHPVFKAAADLAVDVLEAVPEA